MAAVNNSLSSSEPSSYLPIDDAPQHAPAAGADDRDARIQAIMQGGKTRVVVPGSSSAQLPHPGQLTDETAIHSARIAIQQLLNEITRPLFH